MKWNNVQDELKSEETPASQVPAESSPPVIPQLETAAILCGFRRTSFSSKWVVYRLQLLPPLWVL